MKTRISKRVVSLFLAVLMVITSVPAVAFSAFAASVDATAADIDDLNDAVLGYETKVKSGKVYRNMEAGYNAYVEAQKARDAYVYGNVASTDIASRTTALINATNAMTEIADTDYKTGTAKASAAEDTAPARTKEESKNILYVPQMSYSTRLEKELGNNVKHSIHFASTAVLRDGVTTPAVPVMSSAIITKNKPRYVYGIYPTSVTAANADLVNTAPVLYSGLELKGLWAGNYGRTCDFGWSIDQTADRPGHQPSNAYGSGQTNTTRSQQLAKGFTSSSWKLSYFANVLLVNTSTNRSSVELKPNWFVASSDSSNSGINDMGIIDGNASLYVVNYKLLIDAIKASAGNFNGTYSISDYKEGGAKAYFAAIDAAFAFDPNTYFSGASTSNLATCVSNCVTEMEARIAALNPALSVDTYDVIRNVMSDEMRNTYRIGNDDGTYEANAWNAFQFAYRTCQNAMALPINNSNGYSDPEVATYANDLSVASENLKKAMIVNKVNTTELESLMSEIWSYEAIFTNSTYAPFIAAVRAADTAIWKSVYDDENPENVVNNYGVESVKPNDSDDAKALVKQHLDAIRAVWVNLRISMNTVVEVVNNVRYSMNDLLAIFNSLDPIDYSNWDEVLKPAWQAAEAYVAQAEAEEFSNYADQYQAYKDAVTALYLAYDARVISFIRMPDGTLASQTSVVYRDTEDSNTLNDKNSWGVHFTTPVGSVVLRTTNAAASYPYGKATLTFLSTVEGYDCHLDSINMQDPDKAVRNAQIVSKLDKYVDMNDGNDKDAKNTYKASLKTGTDGYKITGDDDEDNKHVTVSYNNIKISSKSNSSVNYAGVSESNTDLYVGDDVTDCLAETGGYADKPLGVMTVKTASSANGYGEVIATGDLCVNIPATENPLTFDQLTAQTGPSTQTYTVNADLGYTYAWKHKPFWTYCGYGHGKAAYTTDVTVIDLANLFTLIRGCDAIQDSTPYVEARWQEFQLWLKAAKENVTLTGSAQNIVASCQTKYEKLYEAYLALINNPKPVAIAFNFNNANGGLSGYTIQGSYGKSLADYADEFNTIVPPQYTKDGYRYTFREWQPMDGSPALDFDHPFTLTETVSYQALYDRVAIPADFTTYNTRIQDILTEITDKEYSVAALNTINNYLTSLTYYTKTDAERASMLWIDHQSAIDAEAKTIQSWYLNNLPSKVQGIDVTAAEAQLEAQKSMIDKDIYDSSAVKLDPYTPVTIVGTDITVDALNFATQKELDAAIAAAMNTSNLSIKSYDVFLNGQLITNVPYGTTLEVHSDGTFDTNADTEYSKAAEQSAWYYQFESPQVSKTAEKFMTAAPSFGFIVKGTTWLTTRDAKTTDTGYVVKFVNSVNNKVFDIINTDANGTFTMPNAPQIAYYTFDSYSNGMSAGSRATVSENTTIVADFVAKTANSFTINVWSSVLYSWTAGEGTPADWSDTYYYNDRVELDGLDLNENYLWGSDPEVWCELFYNEETGETTFKPLYYGCDYIFNASRDVDLIPMSKDEFFSFATDGYSVEYNGFAMDNMTGDVYGTTVQNDIVKVYDDNDSLSKFEMIGTFVLPEGYTLVEAGILFTTTIGSDLTMENVGKNGIKRMKSTKYTPGKQFVISINAQSVAGQTIPMEYCSYLICKDANGNLVDTIYSAAVTHTGVTL